MKKIIILTLLLCIIPLIAIGNEIPAPFAKAKELALKATPNDAGNYILVFEGSDASYYFYLLGYIPGKQIIGVGKLESKDTVVAEYHEATKEFSFWVNGYRYMDVDKTKVIEFAFKVFRELVARKLI